MGGVAQCWSLSLRARLGVRPKQREVLLDGFEEIEQRDLVGPHSEPHTPIGAFAGFDDPRSGFLFPSASPPTVLKLHVYGAVPAMMQESGL